MTDRRRETLVTVVVVVVVIIIITHRTITYTIQLPQNHSIALVTAIDQFYYYLQLAVLVDNHQQNAVERGNH